MLQRHVIYRELLKTLGIFLWWESLLAPGRRVKRRCWLKVVLREVKPHLDNIYLDLELDADRRKLEDAETYLKYHQDKCVVIDEVQRMPELFPLLRALVDIERRPGRFILLGSRIAGDDHRRF